MGAERSALRPVVLRPVQAVHRVTSLPRRSGAGRTRTKRIGMRVQQSPAYARAVSAAGGRVVVAMGNDVVAAFTRGAAVCSAIGGDEPLLGGIKPRTAQLVSVVTAVRWATGLPVYLPLVDDRYAEVSGHSEYVCWERPPNSVIDWTRQGRDLWDRVRSAGPRSWTASGA